MAAQRNLALRYERLANIVAGCAHPLALDVRLRFWQAQAERDD